MLSSIAVLNAPVVTISRKKERLSRETKSQLSIDHAKESKRHCLLHRTNRVETLVVSAFSKPRAISASFISLRLSSYVLWWTWSARVIAFGLFSPEFSARALVDELPHRLPRYPCEDVSQFYSRVEHAQGVEMMEQLNLLISAHHPLSYKEVWDALKILDAADVENPEASSDIVEIYSLRAVPKSLAGKPEGWNRERLWPRSYGLARGPSLTELHPADVNVNSSRGNKFHGECLHEDNSCLRPANSEAAPDTEADKQRWAPPGEVRGDIARSLMYMAVRYGLHQPIGSSTLQLLIHQASMVQEWDFLQNGPADGIALVSCRDDGTNEVIQFLSYEAVTTAIDGPGIGSLSMDIGVRETEDSSELGSLRLTGNGLRKSQWKRFTTRSTGRLNPGEDLGKP